MFSKIRTAMLALAAVAAVGAAIVTTTSEAEARFGGGGFRGGGGGGMSMRMAGPRMGGMRHIGVRHVGIHRHGIHRHIHLRRHVHIHRPHWCHRFPWRCNVRVGWPRPIIYGAPVIAAAATYAAPVAAAPRCSCLTKQYTPEGLVVFQDVCTKEVASAPQGTTALPAPPANTTYQSQTELQPQPEQPQTQVR